MSQNRQPRGVPAGGEFAESQHDEAEGSLVGGSQDLLASPDPEDEMTELDWLQQEISDRGMGAPITALSLEHGDPATMHATLADSPLDHGFDEDELDRHHDLVIGVYGKELGVDIDAENGWDWIDVYASTQIDRADTHEEGLRANARRIASDWGDRVNAGFYDRLREAIDDAEQQQA